MRLLCWFLLYRIHPEESVLGHHHEAAACRHCRLSQAEFSALKHAFPREWEKLKAKRARRREFLLTHGSIRDGWTPPDPKDKRSANFPLYALAARDQPKGGVPRTSQR